jgi:magnesium transporter
VVRLKTTRETDMTETAARDEEQLVEAVMSAIDEGDDDRLRDALADLHPADSANLVASIPEPDREHLWNFMPEETAGEVISHLDDVARESLIGQMEPHEVASAVGALELDDLVDLVESIPEEYGDAIRESLDPEGRERLEATLAYPEDSAGRLMDVNAVTVRADVTLEVVLRYLRRRESLPDHTDGLMVVDRDGMYIGKLPISSLLINQPELSVAEVMIDGADCVQVEMPESEVAHLFDRRDLVSVAVIDISGRLVGRITIDDVVDVIRAEAEHQLMNMAGLDEEEDLFAPVLPSARRRALWLGVNLGTAFLASWVIGLFEATLAQLVALAVLMPIVASMGGIAGSQTLTLVIRGLALGRVNIANRLWLARKELAIAFLNGTLWALVVGVIAYVWFRNPGIGLVLSAAMVVNLLVAAFSGIAIPRVMDRLKIDPALAGAVVLTTVTDVVGFMSFLGLATCFLL